MQNFQTFVKNLETDITAMKHAAQAVAAAAAKLKNERLGRGIRRNSTAAAKARNAYLDGVVSQSGEHVALLDKKLAGVNKAKSL